MTIVQTKLGALRGVICENIIGKYLAFKGIPYAKPPVGNLRFKAPEPPEPWEGVRDLTKHGPVCPQYNERMDRIDGGSEDCLYLNIYVPHDAPQQPLPVMTWIHGGGFYTGSGDSDFYGPEFFMQYDVILVTFNYRLEVLGFLCLDNDEVPGNAGLKDQVAALKWVKENISAFGGDSNNITIFGCSAGGASVSLHLISKMSQNLFNKAICQSGVCTNDWCHVLYGRERAFQLGKLLGKETEDDKELLDFLRSVPVSSLVNIKLPPDTIKDLADSILFGPVVEKSLTQERFLTHAPLELVAKGCMANVPAILGYTSGEGIEITRNFSSLQQIMSMDGFFVPRELKLKLPMDKLKLMNEKIRNQYLCGSDITNESIQAITDLETFRMFAYNIHRFAYYHSQLSNPVFLYKFAAETERNYTKKQYKMNEVKGVCHADDLYYLFHVTCLDVPLTEESRCIIENFVRLWTNFAKTGNPTPCEDQWKPFTISERNCYIINELPECVENADEEHISFWRQLYDEVNAVG